MYSNTYDNDNSHSYCNNRQEPTQDWTHDCTWAWEWEGKREKRDLLLNGRLYGEIAVSSNKLWTYVPNGSPPVSLDMDVVLREAEKEKFDE